ncbi:MAG: hypothetical protein AB1815_06905 [Bacillota bacterium]
MITELIRPLKPASAGGGFQRAVKSSMDSANIQRGLNSPLNEVSFNMTEQARYRRACPALFGGAAAYRRGALE